MVIWPNGLKPLHTGGCMYKKDLIAQQEFEDFYLPFGGELSSNNRWVRLAKIVPWDKAETLYRKQFSKIGSPTESLRSSRIIDYTGTLWIY